MSTNKNSESEIIESYETDGQHSQRQTIFLSFSFTVLVDLTVLNLFNEYWDHVFIENFTVSLFAAVLLQSLLRVTMAIEHRVADYFNKKPGLRSKILRYVSAWGILFISKLVILWAIDLFFGSSILFSGLWHGVVAFIFVVIVIIVVEQIFVRTYWSLA